MVAGLSKRRTLGFIVVALLVALISPPGAGLAATLGQAASEPDISASAGIVVEYPTGRILFNKNMHERRAPASTTKITTAILALEHGNLEREVKIVDDDLVGESTMGLQAGETQTIHNLLYGMLLPSGNDAAMAIAREIGTEESAGLSSPKSPVANFVDMMNARVSQLGLADTHFKNPHGLDADGHYSSAYDLASLTWYALHIPAFNEIVKQQFYEAPGHPLKNANEMLSRYPGADGVKTGLTDAAGLCLVTSATRDGHRLISVVLNAPRWYADSGAILDYGFARLAASPEDASAERLSVAQRGAASFMLASATSTPPITPVVVANQGGGSVASLARQISLNAPEHQASVAVAPQNPAGVNEVKMTAGLPVQVSSLLLFLAALAFLVVLGGGIVLTGRRWSLMTRTPLMAHAAGPGAANVDLAGLNTSEAIASARPVARTLGAPPEQRRREPNLLLTAEDEARTHVARAIALSADGREGSSMSEFLLALRLGQRLDAAEVSSAYIMPPEAYLALSRAQVSAGHREDALATLEYALERFPSDRFLNLALRQLLSRQ